MKNKLMIIAIAAFALVGTTSYAQSADESNVRILRTLKPGIIKLHYALETNEPLSVKFFTNAGLVGTDRITGEFPKGFSKKYDVREISGQEYWIEVTSSRGATKYRVTPSGKKAFTATLETAIDNQALVKRNN
jgi:hypothetical protein